MKTPMQELIDKLYELSEMHASDMYKAGMRDAAIIAEMMLEKEKEAIQSAFYEGMLCQRFDPNMGRAEMYYIDTFEKLEKTN
jgi:hypothetical protein